MITTNVLGIRIFRIYLAGSDVQCYARAVNKNGQPGKELGSGIVTIGFILQAVMFSVMLEQ